MVSATHGTPPTRKKSASSTLAEEKKNSSAVPQSSAFRADASLIAGAPPRVWLVYPVNQATSTGKHDMPLVKVNRCNLYYEDQGSGPPIVFVHGESHGIEMFKAPIAQLSDRYRCIAYYRRGHGKSELPRYGYSLWNQVIDLAELMDALRIERAIFVAV